MSRPSDTSIAEVYQVHRRQVSRWKTKGIDVMNPAQVLESLAGQNRPGRTLDRLLAPGALESISEDIHKLSTSKP